LRSIKGVKLIAITGGIGSGKSVVARMVQVMGFQVYDCDSKAKSIMTDCPEVRLQLEQAFGKDTFLADGSINRQHLSSMAFADNDALAKLNGIVHPATARDLCQWSQQQAKHGASLAFVETALLHTAKLDQVVDGVWHVTAPTQIRIKRVMARSGLTAQQVEARIRSQIDEDLPVDGESVINNDGDTALLPQVLQLLTQLKNTSNK